LHAGALLHGQVAAGQIVVQEPERRCAAAGICVRDLADEGTLHGWVARVANRHGQAPRQTGTVMQHPLDGNLLAGQLVAEIIALSTVVTHLNARGVNYRRTVLARASGDPHRRGTRRVREQDTAARPFRSC
jgi:hypothetical protein